jgi:DNA-binding NtrC family response regulator
MHRDAAIFTLDPDLQRDVVAARHYDVPVLITGRDLAARRRLARHIHDRSGRARTFVMLRDLDDWEIDAFRLRHATFFIDDVATLDERRQDLLMQLLEHRAAAVPPTWRVIAASDARLYEAMLQRQFRADLYYRLAVIHIVIPDDRRIHGLQ